MTLAPNMLMALRAVRDGGHRTRAELFWLRSEFYIDENNKLTMRGHNELNEDEKRKEDKPK